MTIAEILRAARAKIDKSENWCKRAFAMDARSIPVESRDAAACRWCAQGAVESVTPYGSEITRTAALRLYECAGMNALAFNDDPGTTHPDVLALYDRAIAAAEAQP